MHNDLVIAIIGKLLFEEFKTNLINDQQQLTNTMGLDILFYTEYQRNGFVYRAHPCYCSENPYYDWVYIKWCVGDDPATHKPKIVSIIGRILTFRRHPDGGIRAVVHSCNYGSHLAQGVFGTFYEMEYDGPQHSKRPKLHLVDVDCLDNHVCMIPYFRYNTLYYGFIYGIVMNGLDVFKQSKHLNENIIY